MKHVKWISFGLLIGLSACTRYTSVDLDHNRQKHLAKDLEILNTDLTRKLSGPLTVSQAIEMGLKNNIELRLARFEELITSKQAMSERLKMLPELNARYDETQTSKLRVSSSENFFTGVQQNADSFGQNKKNRTKSIIATWNILDFGLSYVRSKKLQLEAQAKEMRRARQEQQIAMDIVHQYWQALLAEQALREFTRIKNDLEKIQAGLDEATTKKQIDLAVAKDFSNNLLSIQLDIHTLRMEVGNSRMELAQLLGVNPNISDFTFEPEISENAIQQLPVANTLNLEKLEDYALHNRPELFEEDLKQEMSVAGVREAIIQYFPTIRFSHGIQRDDNPFLLFNQWTEVSTNIAWNLLGLPSNFFAHQAAKQGVELAKAERLGVTMSIIAQTQIAALDYRMQQERFELLMKKHQNSQELVNLAHEKFKRGMASSLDLSKRALEALSDSIKHQKGAIDLLVAHKRLLASAGLPATEWGPNANIPL